MLDTTRSTLQPLLAPSAIAVIGASRRETAIGHQILSNLITDRFAGPVYPVNPHARALCSVRTVPTIGAISDPVDLAVIVVPKAGVVDIATQCGEQGVKGLVVISAGFGESGPEGVARERELMQVVQRYGMRLVGPNCLGIVNTAPAVSMNATFSTAMPPYGPAAFVSQSGALGLCLLDHAREYGIGISQFVSVGNEPDVSGNDLLAAWEGDPAVEVILMYLENFRDPQTFLALASRITKAKPVIVLKAGRSRAGARAAASHTGALAADDTMVDALLAQAGALRARTVEELFELAIAFTMRAKPRSQRTAVLTNAGGPAILAADALEAAGLDLAELSSATTDTLRPLFPPEASIRNPLDMIASATPDCYKTAVTAVLADPVIDAVVPIFVPTFGVTQAQVADAIASAAATQPQKPVLAVLMGVEGLAQGRATLHEAGVPTYSVPESAARVLAALNRQMAWSSRPLPSVESLEGDRLGATALIAAAHYEQREWLTPFEALQLLRAYRIPIAESRAANDVGSALAAAKALGYPLVMKVMSPDVIHKSDVGGVRVGLRSDAEVEAAFTALTERFRTQIQTQHPATPLSGEVGVLMQRMIDGRRETIAGITRDPMFGTLIMFGLGGTLVEVLSDVVFRIAPIDHRQGLDMVLGLRGARLLGAFRGEPPADYDAFATMLQRLGQLAADLPDLRELDINPFILSTEGMVAVDARVRLHAKVDVTHAQRTDLDPSDAPK